MNFLPCTLEGQHARVDGVTIALEPETAARGPQPGGRWNWASAPCI
jgi:hypothetical protein